MADMVEMPVERARQFRDLVDAVRRWRGALIPNTSTATLGPTRKLLETIAVFDTQPCEHPRGWRVFSSRSQDADEVCAYCGTTLIAGLTALPLPADPEGDAFETSYARHPSVSGPSSPPDS